MEVCFVVFVTLFLLASDRGSMMRLLSRRSYEAAWALSLPCWCLYLTQLTLKANVTVFSLSFTSILCRGCGCVRASDTVLEKKVFSVPPASAIRFRSVILWLDAHIFLCQQLHVGVQRFPLVSRRCVLNLCAVDCLRGDVMLVPFLFAHCECDLSCVAYSKCRALYCMIPMTTHLLP